MASVTSKILAWARTLPAWEQQAIAWLLEGRSLDESHYDLLTERLLWDAGLSAGERPPPTTDLSSVHPVPDETQPRPLLRAIRNLRNVNALASHQELHFGPGLTVVYGKNGSGKSGYARVLACAGFTRGDKTVLTDLTSPDSVHDPQHAEIEIEENGSARTITYSPSTRTRELVGFYVFDSTSVRSHLTGRNSFSFSPAGLRILSRLADIVDTVKRRVEQLIQHSRPFNPFLNLFQGDSEVAAAVRALGARTDLDRLAELSDLNDDDHARAAAVERELEALRARQLREQIKTLKQGDADDRTHRQD